MLIAYKKIGPWARREWVKKLLKFQVIFRLKYRSKADKERDLLSISQQLFILIFISVKTQSHSSRTMAQGLTTGVLVSYFSPWPSQYLDFKREAFYQPCCVRGFWASLFLLFRLPIPVSRLLTVFLPFNLWKRKYTAKRTEPIKNHSGKKGLPLTVFWIHIHLSSF